MLSSTRAHARCFCHIIHVKPHWSASINVRIVVIYSWTRCFVHRTRMCIYTVFVLFVIAILNYSMPLRVIPHCKVHLTLHCQVYAQARWHIIQHVAVHCYNVIHFCESFVLQLLHLHNILRTTFSLHYNNRDISSAGCHFWFTSQNTSIQSDPRARVSAHKYPGSGGYFPFTCHYWIFSWIF